MAHHNRHGGWAAQAKRQGKEYQMCNECGGRKHPRNLLQADWSEVDPADRRSGCLQGINAILVSVLIVLILIWALVEVFGAR
jgi:hypothetical protein